MPQILFWMPCELFKLYMIALQWHPKSPMGACEQKAKSKKQPQDSRRTAATEKVAATSRKTETAQLKTKKMVALAFAFGQ